MSENNQKLTAFQKGSLVSICVVATLALAFATGHYVGQNRKIWVYEQHISEIDSELKKSTDSLDVLTNRLAECQKREGLGISRQEAIRHFTTTLGMPFKNVTLDKSKEHFRTKVDGVFLSLWGPEDDLTSIMVIGTFEGRMAEPTFDVLRECLNLVAPNWEDGQRIEWFEKASSIKDPDLSICHLIENTEVDLRVIPSVVANDGSVMRFISFLRYPN